MKELKLNEKLNDDVRGWSDFHKSDFEDYEIVCNELKALTCFADITLGSAHKMCKHLKIGVKKININEFSKFFDI